LAETAYAVLRRRLLLQHGLQQGGGPLEKSARMHGRIIPVRPCQRPFTFRERVAIERNTAQNDGV
jgi:hypothetical protein